MNSQEIIAHHQFDVSLVPFRFVFLGFSFGKPETCGHESQPPFNSFILIIYPLSWCCWLRIWTCLLYLGKKDPFLHQKKLRFRPAWLCPLISVEDGLEIVFRIFSGKVRQREMYSANRRGFAEARKY